MHKVSAKRQVTIPKELCEKAGIKPGNLVEIFEYEGKVTVIKKETGASTGILKTLEGKAAITDDESLQDALENNNKAGKKGRVA